VLDRSTSTLSPSTPVQIPTLSLSGYAVADGTITCDHISTRTGSAVSLRTL
jgi:hypothetical protein